MKRDLKTFMRGESMPLDKSTVNDVEDTIEKFSGKNDDELMGELHALKANGTINNEALSDMAQTIGPMLSTEQKERLDALIRQLSE